MVTTRRLPIIDGHNDVLLQLYFPDRGGGRTFFEESKLGHIDLPRARTGGFAGGFFAVFVPSDPSLPPPSESDGSLTETEGKLRLASSLDLTYAQKITIA